MSRFKIGDRIRACDFGPNHKDCFVEIVVNVLEPAMRQYGGLTVRDVCGGEEVKSSSRLGFNTRVPMEGMHRDWEGRLTLVERDGAEGWDLDKMSLPSLLRPQV
jgi:hypothetical protein